MEKKEKVEIQKSMTRRGKVVYFVVLGLFLLIIGGLVFASLQ